MCINFNGYHSGGSTFVNVNDCWLLQKLFVYHIYKFSLEKEKKNKESQYMVSHPENGSDSPIGSDRDRGRDILGRDLDMNFHCCQGFTTSGPLILVCLSCCNLLQPVISVMLSHLLLLLLQKFLFLLNSLLHTSLVSFSIFLHIN